MKLSPDDWQRVFALDTPLLELIARGSVLYLGILLLMRFMPRRSAGELAVMDLIFLFLIAEGASHALGDYTSVSDGLVVILTIMGWDYAINALSYHAPSIERLVSPPPSQVIRDGRLLRRNMRREFLTEDELMGHLRQQSIEDVKSVKAAHVEGDGSLTITDDMRRD